MARLSFVSAYTLYWSRLFESFDRLLLVFKRRWCRLAVQDYKLNGNVVTGDWCITVATTADTIMIGELRNSWMVGFDPKHC